MAEALERVFPKHARAGVAHHRPDLFPARALVAMDRASGASRFFLAKPAAFQPERGVIQQPVAVGAQRDAGFMMIAAINSDHGLQRSPFADEPLASNSNRRLPSRAGEGVRCKRGNGRFHPLTLAWKSPGVFDAGQGLDAFEGTSRSRDLAVREQDRPMPESGAGRDWMIYFWREVA
jgi:hypothetical protein